MSNLGFPEGVTPRNTDSAERSLQKINSVLSAGGSNASTTAATFLQGVKTVAATATPERLVASSTLVDSVELFARKAAGTANTGNIFIGPASADGAQLRIMAPGDSITYSAPAGKKIDLYNIYVDVATAGDGVVYTALS
jgi:hypothetical protein